MGYKFKYELDKIAYELHHKGENKVYYDPSNYKGILIEKSFMYFKDTYPHLFADVYKRANIILRNEKIKKIINGKRQIHTKHRRRKFQKFIYTL